MTIEDNVISGGFGDHLANKLADEHCHVIRFGWPDTFIEHGSFDELADKYGLTPEKIAVKVLEYIKEDAVRDREMRERMRNSL